MTKRVSKEPEERKAEIVEAAFVLFKENGFASTSVSQIVKKIGVAQGTFYYHFESKTAILYEILYRKFINLLIQRVVPIVENHDYSALEKLQKIAQLELELSLENLPEIVKIENADLFRRIFKETVREYVPYVAKAVQQGVEEQVFDIEYPLEACAMFHVTNFFFLHPAIFRWNKDELERNISFSVCIMERGFGAKPGTLHFYKDVLKKLHISLQEMSYES